MVKAIEARDPYTSGHSVRVSELSRAIAVELGLPAKEIEQVETAALLHDVGKIHEEFAPLLRKEGRLTEEETALMQTHSTRSAELVGIISKFRGFIQDSVRHHHERWDGQGYPWAFGQEHSPCLTHHPDFRHDRCDDDRRPYRKRLGLEVVVAELQKCKGTQFDPELVDVTISSVAVRRLIAGTTASALALNVGANPLQESELAFGRYLEGARDLVVQAAKHWVFFPRHSSPPFSAYIGIKSRPPFHLRGAGRGRCQEGVQLALEFSDDAHRCARPPSIVSAQRMSI